MSLIILTYVVMSVVQICHGHLAIGIAYALMGLAYIDPSLAWLKVALPLITAGFYAFEVFSK